MTLPRSVLLILINVLFVSNFGVANAQTASETQKYMPPKELPPASFDGLQYVDSLGCVFVRAGVADTIIWVPRLDAFREQLCGYPPTILDSGVSQLAEAQEKNMEKGVVQEVLPKVAQAFSAVSVMKKGDEKPNIASASSANVLASIEQNKKSLSGQRYFVYLGAFSVASNALKVINVVTDLGLPHQETDVSSSGKVLNLVKAGPFNGRDEAQDKLRILKEKGFKDAYIGK